MYKASLKIDVIFVLQVFLAYGIYKTHVTYTNMIGVTHLKQYVLTTYARMKLHLSMHDAIFYHIIHIFLFILYPIILLYTECKYSVKKHFT